MLILSLPVLVLALTIHPSCASSSSRLSKATEIDGRLFYRHSLFPVDAEFCNEERNSGSKRATLEETLDALLIQPLAVIVADYSYGSRSRQFAEELYHELWEGKTDLLCKELCDFEKGVLKKPHHFWGYLSQGAQRVVAFVYMLSGGTEEVSEV